MSTEVQEKICCEYSECTADATVWNDELEAWLCEKHDNSVDNSTGYCTRDCILGYGCDGSC